VSKKQANKHTHGCNVVTLVWDSLRLAPTMDKIHLHMFNRGYTNLHVHTQQ